MFERWRKIYPGVIREYQIDRIHGIAIVRILTREGDILNIEGASSELIKGELTLEKLTEKGYYRKERS